MDFPYQGIISTPLVQELFPDLEFDEELLEEIPVLDQSPATVVTPRVDQVCGRLFKYYQNFRVEGHLPTRAGASVERKVVEIHGASPEIRWVSDEVVPGYYCSVRVDNALYQVSEAFLEFSHFLEQLQIKDIVLVEPEVDYYRDGNIPVNQSINPLANQYW